MARKKQQLGEWQIIKKTWPFIRPYKKEAVLTLFFVIIVALIELSSPYFQKLIVDTLTDLITSKSSGEEVFNSILLITIAYFLIISLGTLCTSFKSYFSEKVLVGTEVGLKKIATDHQLSFDYCFYEDQNIGKLIQKVYRGVEDFKNTIRDLIWEAVPGFVKIITLIPLFFLVSWQIALITLICVPLFLFINYKLASILKESQKKIVSCDEKRVGLFHQAVSNILLVKLFHSENFESNKYDNITNKIGEEMMRKEWEWQKYTFLGSTVLNINRFLVLLVCGYLAINGSISIGDVVMVFGYNQLIYSPLHRFTFLYNRINVAKIGINRFLQLIEVEPKIKDAPDARELKIEKGGIEFRDVDFKYKNKWVFKSLNFKVEPGQTVALVGPSGVGKSTIAKLLARLYDVDKGEILIDGQDIKEVTQKSLRDKIGVVPQEDLIFDNTLRYNIKYGNSQVSEEEIISAAKKAHADKFISRLPKGYDTLVGERGIRLSGGEKQRLAIARAILKNAPILVLDEATSSLDSQSEIYVQEGMKELIQNKTSLIIAHRLSTIMKADKILVFDKGKIVESGTHKELLKKKGLYYKLFSIQSCAFLIR